MKSFCHTTRISILLMAGSIGLASLAVAQTLSPDQIRTRLLDQCVYDQWGKRNDKTDIVSDCSCAAKETAGTLTPKEVSRFERNERLDRNGRAKFQAAMQACV